MNRKSNALVARPPEQLHRLGTTGDRLFRSLMGRMPRADDYHGVHTSPRFEIAAVYVYGAWDVVRKREPASYPVVIALDVRGLEPLPDVDAMVNAAQFLSEEQSRLPFFEDDISLYEAPDFWEEQQSASYAGDDTGTAIIEMTQARGPWEAFATEEEWDRWKETGEFLPEHAMRLTEQRRYLVDFGMSRLVQVVAIRPWWPQLLDIYDERSECVAQAVEEAGRGVVTVEDVYGGWVPLDKYLVYGPVEAPESVEFHGTSSYHLAQAFPELDMPQNPFPVQEVDLDEICP